jgi:hypothetical protein
MKWKLGLMVLLGWFVYAGTVWADETSLQRQIDQLKQRVVELETRDKNSPESSSTGAVKDINDKINLSGVIAGVYQYENADAATDDDEFGRGAFSFQPEVSINLDESDELFLHFGFAAGDGLNTDRNPFVLTPWAADLESDVKNINGRNRDYLLEAWYKHTFTFGKGHTLGVTGGIIDATAYLDENNYANDQYTQFMNAALVNGPNFFLPSYDTGGALEWQLGEIAVKGVVMQVGENDDGRSYSFYGVQMGYTLETPLGEGVYRLVVDTTSDSFSDPDGEGTEPLKGVSISFDQALGDILGVWIRCGWNDDTAIIDFQDLYSGGIDVNGKLWGRGQDNLGIGYARLSGGNQDIDRAQVLEAYVRFGLNETMALSVDAQYLEDTYNHNAQDDVDGWITGLRLVVEF